MLSAIAARKAAEAARLTAVPSEQHFALNADPSPSLSCSEDSGSQSSGPKNALTSNKRKPSLIDPGSAVKKKKRKKFSRAENNRSRYFEQQQTGDVFNQQDDVIVIDAALDNSTGSSSASDSEGDKLNVVPGASQQYSDGNLAGRGKRAWSPSQPLQLSSDDDLDDNPTYSSKTVAQSAPVPLMTTFCPASGSNMGYLSQSNIGLFVQSEGGTTGTILALAPGETVSIVGAYVLIVLRGSVSLAGVDLTFSAIRHRIFAPQCSPIPVIRALHANMSPGWDAEHFSIPETLKHLFNGAGATILIQELRTGVEDLGRICRTFGNTFGPINNSGDVLRIPGAQMISQQESDLHPFHLTPSWTNVLSSNRCAPFNADLQSDDQILLETQPLVALVKGPKRTGKSTLARTLLNRLTKTYRRVAYIECDPGQTDFTPPGMVSLHIVEQPVFGPSYCNPAIPLRAHYIGSTSPRSSPSHYLNSIHSLLQTYRLEVQYSEGVPLAGDGVDIRIGGIVPLVVNTMGWVKGLGADLSRQIEEMVEPTHVFNIRGRESSEPDFRFQAVHSFTVEESNTHDGPSPVIFDLEPFPGSPLMDKYTAADWRTMSILSYFHGQFPSPDASATASASIHGLVSWDTTLPLLERKPYTVTPNIAFDNVILVGPGSEDVIPPEIGRVLNGAVVALVRSDAEARNLLPAQIADGPSIPYIQGEAAPDPQTTSCVGLALIRAVSHSLISDAAPATGSRVLHILTPIPPPLLASARCVVKGEIELPIWGMLDFKEFEGGRGKEKEKERANAPYLQWSRGEGIGADRRRVRRNLMRKAQM